MPLHGKIVVVKRSGGDGTEFPLTTTCLFGRKPDCDIRIQLPQVSKEHCRIDLNENKEVILTNLSSVNPTRVNGDVLQQSERLKHGDVITIIDRSFRFEYPPAPTPKKRSSVGGKTETFKVLQDQQVVDTVSTETGEKRISEVSTDPHLKDGANHDNIQRSLEKTMELESKEDGSGLQSKTISPFSDLYQMIKKSLDVKTPRKSSASVLQTPNSRFCTPKPVSVRKNVIATEDKSTPKKNEAEGADEIQKQAENASNGTPKSAKKQRKSVQVPSTEMVGPEAECAANSETTSPQKRIRTPPQRFTVGEVIERTCESPKSPQRRRSKEATPAKASPKTENFRKPSPRNSGKAEKVKGASKKRKSGELGDDLQTSQMKKKRVSFGGYLCPELFDKRLPPDSPLRKGATPRRSLCLAKPKQSLLRRASDIGLRQDSDSPAKRKTASPKKSSSASPKTPTPGKKSPKSKTPSPKAATPAKKSPKSRSPSPKAATPGAKSPKSRTNSPKAATPAKQSPKSKTPSPKAATPGRRSPSKNNMEAPKANEAQTPTVQGRFSVSRISTPSPVAEDAVTEQMPSVAVTPKLPLRRKSTSRKTPGAVKSAVKAMQRRSGISRASMKVKCSWVNIVKFGTTKAQVAPQVAVPAKTTVTKKTTKKAVSKPQTPARKFMDHCSTGHADSPVTIVVGRAHQRTAIHPTGAAPKLVTNIALLRKNMKMDEDLSGVSEMFKTPVNERKRRSGIGENSAMETPVGARGTSVVEPSVLNTPEEPGEMIVSPLSVSSTVKESRYNSEAVQRLLDEEQESSFVSDVSGMETHSDDSSEQQCADLKMTSVTTPKQKPELPECLTGVKRIVKTPRQKAEPVEDLRGRLLKTPKQKLELQECLTGVKRIMKTPKQKAEPVEDLRGKILKTPKQKPEQQQLCLTGVKRIFETPQKEAEPLEDLKGKLLETPKALEAGDASDVQEAVETLAHMEESEDLKSEMTDMATPNVKKSPSVCLTGIKRLMKTPREKSAPVEDMVGVEMLMKTPKDESKPVEEDFDIKTLEKSPVSNTPVEDSEEVEAQMSDPAGQLETNEVEDQTPLDCGVDVAKELDFAPEELQDVPSDVVDVPQVDLEKEDDADEVVVNEVQSGHDNDESSDAAETISQAAVEDNSPVEESKIDSVDENASEEQSKVDSLDENVSDKQPEAITVDETASEKHINMDTVEEKVSEEPPKVDTVEQHVPEEQLNIDTVEQHVPEEQLNIDTVEQHVPEEQLNIDTVEQHVPEEQLNIDTVEEKVSEEPKVETASSKVTEMDTTATDPDVEKKPVRGRRAKVVDSKPAEDKQEEPSEEAVVPAPVRGRRGKKTEAAAPPAVRQTTRGRHAKSQESSSADDQPEVVPEKAVEATVATEISTEAVSDEVSPINTPEEEKESAPPAEEAVVKPTRGRKTKQAAPKPKRGRNAKKDEDQAEIVQEVATETEMVPEPESAPVDVDHEAKDSAAPPEKAAPKPKRGRKTKQPEESVPEPDVAKEVNEVCSDENTSPDAVETVPEAPVTESLPEVETAAVVDKKPVRGRKAKVVESKPAEDKQEETEPSEEPVAPAPVRGRRGKKTEAAAPPAVRQTTRGRHAKSQESSSADDQPEVVPEKAVEATPATEISTEAPEEEKESAPPAEEAVVKPTRGRKTKVVSDDVTADAQQSIPATKPRRGRKTKPDTVEQSEVVEEVAVVTVGTKQQPPVRAKRGRNAKQEEEKVENNGQTTSVEVTQEPVKKSRRTKKAEEDHVEPREEVQTVEVPEETEAPLVAEPVTTVAAKARRGGRKTKQDAESETPVESTDVQEVPAVSSTDKPKRGRRGKQVTEEVEVTAEVPEEKPEHEEAEEKNAEPEAPVVKPSRARGAKTSAKNEVSQAVPAKRARRGAALPLEETNAESTVLVSEPTPVEPAKRGRRAAAKPTTDDAAVTSDQPNPAEDSSSAVVEESKTSKRSVKWKAELEEIQKVTPVKAVRGRKNVSKGANKTEEKDLSDEVVEAQPAKRARRGAKVADVTTEEESASGEAETQPKTRRGRSAKK